MVDSRPELKRPGFFGVEAAADSRRSPFDHHNEALLVKAVSVDAVFIGDSITDWWAVDAFFVGTRGALVNRGIGGDETSFLRRRFDADALQLRPRLIVLKIGVNNTWALDEPWEPSRYVPPNVIEENIVSDIDAMVTAARVQDIDVALCSILPVNMPVNGNTAERNGLIVRVNARLREIAEHHGAVYVDYHAHMVGPDGLTLLPELSDDGLHPHVLGYEIMARVLLDALSSAGIDVIRARPSA